MPKNSSSSVSVSSQCQACHLTNCQLEATVVGDEAEQFANVHQALLHSDHDVREYNLDALLPARSFGSSVPACFLFVCFFCMVITIKIEQIMNFEFSIFFAGIRVTKKLWNCLYSLSLSANHLALAALSWKKIALGWFTTKDTHMGKVSNWLIVSPVLLRAQPRVMTSPLTVWDPLDFAENAVPDYERANVFYTASCTGYCFGS